MEINLKIKFDKHQKRNTWDRPEMPYFFDSAINTKRTRYSPKSMREDHKLSSTRKEKDFNATASSRKIATARKASSSRAKIEPRPNTLKRSGSTKLRKGRKNGQVISKEGAREARQTQGVGQNEQMMDGLGKSLPGLSGKKVIQRYEQVLSENQRIELINEKTVYYVGLGRGVGEDDLEGRYLWRRHQQMGFRYELLEGLGRGAFGEVVKAYDHKVGELVAVKIVRAGREQMQLALNEINILMRIKERDIQNRRNLLRIRDFIVFRRHICIITELLGSSLYQLLERGSFRGLELANVRAFAIQILFSLAFLKQVGVVHSDLKPQNVLMKVDGKVGIKLIDFGTSMFLKDASYAYVQSRFYRAPEVILGASYATPIDTWSLGCLLAELATGSPLFPGDNEHHQLSLILRALGAPPAQFLAKCRHTQKYFNKDLTPKVIKGKDGKALIPGSRPLEMLIPNPELCVFLEKLLRIDPEERLTPLQALAQPWVLDYFPENMRKEHLNDVLLKIKKEQGGIEKEPKGNSGVKGHKKRNSELHGGVAMNHRRRGSEGIF